MEKYYPDLRKRGILKISYTYFAINISRLLLASAGCIIAKFYSYTTIFDISLLLVFTSLTYLLVETFFDLTNRFSNFSFFVSAIDLTIIYFFVYLTGMNSFFLGGTIYATALCSLNPKIRQGLFCVLYCLFLHLLLLVLLFTNSIEYYNFLQEGEKINRFSLILGFMLTHIVNILIYSIIIVLQRKLQKQNEELENERNKLQQSYNALNTDLNMARKIQNKLIPKANPYPFISFLYHPMMHVGGDFFDFVNFRDPNKLGIFLSDVSGHGVPAAFITSMLKTAILQSGIRKENPAEFLFYLNEVLFNQIGGFFLTGFYCVYDIKDNSLLFSNAGHNWPIIVEGENIRYLSGGRSSAIGIFQNHELIDRNKKYQNHEIKLNANSKLLLYTDGFTETRSISGDGIFFEENEMEKTLRNLSSLKGQTFLNELFLALQRFRGSNQFEDDVCIISLEINNVL